MASENLNNWPDDSIFGHFTTFDETFKTVHSHEIKTAILLPKNLKPGLHPVIFNYHGGFLVYGHGLFSAFFSPWVLQLALEKQAVIVSPDYRLLPSANGVADVLEDLEDFWAWTRSELQKALGRSAPGQTVDLAHVLLTGNSAGGFCAIQTGLSHPDEVKAAAVAYPEVDTHDPLLANGPKEGEPTVLHFPAEDIPGKEAVLKWISEAKKTVRSRLGHEGGPFGVGATTHGLYISHIFDSQGLNRIEFDPLERVKAGARLPKNVWILQGDNDSVIHVRAVTKFVDTVKEKLPETAIRYDVAHGEDHGFELRKAAWELHAIGALDFVRKSWLE